MKKLLSIIITLGLFCSMMFTTGVFAATLEIDVITDQIDNQEYEEGQKVTVICEGLDLTAIDFDIEVQETNFYSIKDIVVINEDTVEFNITMYLAPEGKYGVRLKYLSSNGVPKTIIEPQALIVKEGKMLPEYPVMNVYDAIDNGIILKMFNNDILLNTVAYIDDIKVEYSTISGRVYKLYPTEELLAGKDEITFKILVQNGYYDTTMKLTEDNLYLESTSYSEDRSFVFEVASYMLEIPKTASDIKASISDSKVELQISDIIVYDDDRLKLKTIIPYGIGDYTLKITWDGAGTIYEIPFSIVTEPIKTNYDLDDSITTLLKVENNKIELKLFEDQILAYFASEKKEIDLSNYDEETFELDLRNESVLMLVENKVDLKILLSDYTIFIPYEELEKVSEKDVYILINKDQANKDYGDMYFNIMGSLNIDSNLNTFDLGVTNNSKAKAFNSIEVSYIDILETQEMFSSKMENGMYYLEYKGYGDYEFLAKSIKFSDVADDFWALEYIYPLAFRTVLDGMGDGSFAPNANITKAQFAKVIKVAAAIENGDGVTSITDISSSDWYFSYIEALEEIGVISDTTYSPNEAMLRKDMAVMVVETYQYVTGESLSDIIGLNPTTEFFDLVGLSDYEKDCIMAAQKLGIINGQSTHVFAPDMTAKRSEASAMIYRMMEQLDLL